MTWKVIRLELASSWEFPRGSAGRTYLIRLPLAEDGTICGDALETQPSRATVRRYWPNQPDMLGNLVRTPMGYAIRYETNGAKRNGPQERNGHGDDSLFQFGAEAIKVGEQICLTEPDGRTLQFRVANLR